MRRCRSCEQSKPLAEFPPDYGRHRRPYCRECVAAMQRARYERLGRAAHRGKPERSRAENEARDRHASRAKIDVTAEDLAYAAVLRADPCAYCGGPGGRVDHIDALSRCGANAWHNLTATCTDCNRRKHALPLLAFMRRSDRP